jgi:flagellar biosynthesis protein FliQ
MQNIDVVLEPVRALLQQIGIFMPRLVLAVVVLVVGWLVAKAFRFSVVKALRALNFHVLTERAGIDGFLQQGGTEKDTTELFGWLAYALVILASLIVAFNSLGLSQVTDLLGEVLWFVPRLLVALLVVVFGSYFARFAGNAVESYCRSAEIGDGGLLGRIMQYGVMVFVVLLAVDHLDIGGGLIQETFLILLAGVVIALALAFGLGGRDRAAALIERWFPRDRGDDPR